MVCIGLRGYMQRGQRGLGYRHHDSMILRFLDVFRG